MGEATKPEESAQGKEKGWSNPEQSTWNVGTEGEAIAPPPNAVPRRNDADDDDVRTSERRVSQR